MPLLCTAMQYSAYYCTQRCEILWSSFDVCVFTSQDIDLLLENFDAFQDELNGDQDEFNRDQNLKNHGCRLIQGTYRTPQTRIPHTSPPAQSFSFISSVYIRLPLRVAVPKPVWHTAGAND